MTVYVTHAVKPKSALTKNVSAAKSTNTGDVLDEIATRVETGSKEKAHARIKELTDVEGGLSDFELGGWLTLIHEKSNPSFGGNKEWLGGHTTFTEFCEKQCDLKYLKAWHLMKVYKFLVERKVPWDDVQTVGWWRLSLLARAKIGEKDTATWIAKAKTLGAKELEMALKGGNVASKTAPLTIRVLHEDQKKAIKAGLEKAKKESNTESDPVALHNVMQAYLGNAVTVAFKCPHCGGFATSEAKLESS